VRSGVKHIDWAGLHEVPTYAPPRRALPYPLAVPKRAHICSARVNGPETLPAALRRSWMKKGVPKTPPSTSNGTNWNRVRAHGRREPVPSCAEVAPAAPVSAFSELVRRAS
jgi:hypothetical protein